ncbi:MAG: hypothetical protein Q9222_007601 [Ikaeria aurantiellina]
MRYVSTSRRARYVGALLLLASIVLFLERKIDLSAPHGPASHDAPVSIAAEEVDWSRFAYVQYATDLTYLCNAVMVFEQLHRLGTKADLLLLYSSDFYSGNVNSEKDSEGLQLSDDQIQEARLLHKAHRDYGAKLKPVTVQRRHDSDPGSATWAASYTKLIAFNQTQYQRIVALDSDSTVLQSMDELFFLPPAPVILPRAYWLDPEYDVTISSAIMVIQPSASEYERITDAIAHAGPTDYDMEVLDTIYKHSAPVLPHRPYLLLSQVFRWENHSSYLGAAAGEEAWDPEAVMKEAKYLHFSEWPLPKPWVRPDPNLVKEHWPACMPDLVTNEATDCRARRVWAGIYQDFKYRRKEVCGLDVDNAGDIVEDFEAVRSN